MRIAVAEGIAALASTESAGVLAKLAADGDPLVRAAALKAAGPLGCPPPLDTLAITALADTAWQVRAGAAEGLGGTHTAEAVTALATAAADGHADVRKATVIALTRWADNPEAANALRAAADDSDADVRAYARQATAL